MRTSPWRLATYVAVVLLGFLIALPNILTAAQLAKLPDWVPKRQVALGLDLRGGSHLVLEVDSKALVQEQLNSLRADAVRELVQAGIEVASTRRENDAITIVLKEPARASAGAQVLRKLGTNVGPAALGAGAPDLAIDTAASGLRIGLTEAGIRDRVNAATEQSLEIIRSRIDAYGVAEPTVQRVGADRILVQLPGVQDPSEVPFVDTAKLGFHMLAPDQSGPVQPGTSALPGIEPGERYVVEQAAALTGDRLSDARAGFDQGTGEPIVSFRFDTAGARAFAAITRANVGRPFAIVLDGKV